MFWRPVNARQGHAEQQVGHKQMGARQGMRDEHPAFQSEEPKRIAGQSYSSPVANVRMSRVLKRPGLRHTLSEVDAEHKTFCYQSKERIQFIPGYGILVFIFKPRCQVGSSKHTLYIFSE